MTMTKSAASQPDTWSKITVVLLDRQVAFLDRIAVDIRLRHGVAISRAELIRALIEAASQSDVTLSDAGEPGGMVEMLRIAWSGGRPRRKK
jgi:hypothetical protein